MVPSSNNPYKPVKGDVVVFFPTKGGQASVGEVLAYHDPHDVRVRKLDQKTKDWYQPMIIPLTQIVEKVSV